MAIPRVHIGTVEDIKRFSNAKQLRASFRSLEFNPTLPNDRRNRIDHYRRDGLRALD